MIWTLSPRVPKPDPAVQSKWPAARLFLFGCVLSVLGLLGRGVLHAWDLGDVNVC